jgi:hypothetical protein
VFASDYFSIGYAFRNVCSAGIPKELGIPSADFFNVVTNVSTDYGVYLSNKTKMTR